MTIGLETFGLTRKDFSEKLSKIISNHRAGSKLIGQPKDFLLRACRLSPQWAKLATDPETAVYLRNVEIAAGRKVKMMVLERDTSKQPVSKSKLIDALYPPKKIATSATPEEKHYLMVKAAMRLAIQGQIRDFRESVPMPTTCPLTGKRIRQGQRTDVDHIRCSFSEIADEYLRAKGLRYVDVALKGPPTAKRFQDEEMWEEWMLYHEYRAEYALVCASANRSKGCGDYKTPQELIGSFSKETPDDLALDF